MSKLRTFLALDGPDRRASLEALVELGVAALLVRFVPPKRWRERFGPLWSPNWPSDDGHTDLATIRRVRLAVARAQRNLPTNPNCLPQALVARRMLARRGVVSELYLGSERDKTGVARFHAWLKVGEEWVTGHCDEHRYSLLRPPGPQAPLAERP